MHQTHQQEIQHTGQRLQLLRRMGAGMKRDEILTRATVMISGDREETYGDPQENFNRIADLWTAYLSTTVTAHDVASMLALMKIARSCVSPRHMDNYIDACGYLAIGAELASPRGRGPHPVGTTDRA